jgi:hypothetical protein
MARIINRNNELIASSFSEVTSGVSGTVESLRTFRYSSRRGCECCKYRAEKEKERLPARMYLPSLDRYKQKREGKTKKKEKSDPKCDACLLCTYSFLFFLLSSYATDDLMLHLGRCSANTRRKFFSVDNHPTHTHASEQTSIFSGIHLQKQQQAFITALFIDCSLAM